MFGREAMAIRELGRKSEDVLMQRGQGFPKLAPANSGGHACGNKAIGLGPASR